MCLSALFMSRSIVWKIKAWFLRGSPIPRRNAAAGRNAATNWKLSANARCRNPPSRPNVSGMLRRKSGGATGQGTMGEATMGKGASEALGEGDRLRLCFPGRPNCSRELLDFCCRLPAGKNFGRFVGTIFGRWKICRSRAAHRALCYRKPDTQDNGRSGPVDGSAPYLRFIPCRGLVHGQNAVGRPVGTFELAIPTILNLIVLVLEHAWDFKPGWPMRLIEGCVIGICIYFNVYGASAALLLVAGVEILSRPGRDLPALRQGRQSGPNPRRYRRLRKTCSPQPARLR